MKKTTVIFVLIFTLLISSACGSGASGSASGAPGDSSASGPEQGSGDSGSAQSQNTAQSKNSDSAHSSASAESKIPDTDESAVGGWGVASNDGSADSTGSANSTANANSTGSGNRSSGSAGDTPFSKVIVDREDLYFAIKDVQSDASLGYTWKVYVENRTDKNLMFTFEKVSVNGVMCDPFWAEIITAGKKGNCEVTWMRDSFEARDIIDVYEVDFTLNVYNDDDYTEAPLMHDPFVVYPLGEDKAAEASAADEAARAQLPSTGKVLVDNDTCSVFVTGYEPDNAWGYAMHVYIRNKSAEDLVFSAENTSINGTMCDPYWSEIVSAGKSALSTILWDKSTLAENSITEVKQISLPLKVYSDKNIAQPYVNETVELEP